MSKQRPSASPRTAWAGPRRAISTSRWASRVFKNTYTRGGRCLKVKGWSVKIQHEGTRRTFSLAAHTRAAAAIEAQAIYQTITRQGWDAVSPLGSCRIAPGHSAAGTESESLPKTDDRYWRRRLIRRHHAPPTYATTGTGGEFSVRIEHEVVSHYFPLGTLDADSAATEARKIYLTVVKEGWEAVNRQFPRELTIALHWADDPLAWTYATFHTVVVGTPIRPRPFLGKGRRPTSVAIVESDPSVRRALCRCVNGQPGFACTATFASARDALRDMPRCSPHAALVSRTLPDIPPSEFLDKLRVLAPGLPVVFFTLHEDSDELFRGTPGGASGYVLKRTPADRLFEPIAEALEMSAGSGNSALVGPLSHVRGPGGATRAGVGAVQRRAARPIRSGVAPADQQIALHVRRYFQNVIHSLSADDSAREMARLTHREHEILNRLSKGYVDKEIAESLGISVWTVHGHLKKIFEKLGVHTRTEAAIKYLHK